jgi:hypothetical protein
LQRNTETTTDAHAMAQEIKAQVPVVKDTLAYVERLLALADPTFTSSSPPPTSPGPNGQ